MGSGQQQAQAARSYGTHVTPTWITPQYTHFRTYPRSARYESCKECARWAAGRLHVKIKTSTTKHQHRPHKNAGHAHGSRRRQKRTTSPPPPPHPLPPSCAAQAPSVRRCAENIVCACLTSCGVFSRRGRAHDSMDTEHDHMHMHIHSHASARRTGTKQQKQKRHQGGSSSRNPHMGHSNWIRNWGV